MKSEIGKTRSSSLQHSAFRIPHSLEPQIRIELHEARDGWRWRARHRNGNIVADSGEAYTRECDALRAADRFLTHIREGDFEYVRLR
jgi:uncharacterized protein YegP (UPF0339 family)